MKREIIKEEVKSMGIEKPEKRWTRERYACSCGYIWEVQD